MLYQGAPGSKFRRPLPLVEVPKAQVEHRICTSFLGAQGMLTWKIFESRLSEMPFPRLWGELLQNSDGQKTTLWHIRSPGQCLLYSLSLGPPFGPLGLGAPRFARSEPIVVTPLASLDRFPAQYNTWWSSSNKSADAISESRSLYPLHWTLTIITFGVDFHKKNDTGPSVQWCLMHWHTMPHCYLVYLTNVPSMNPSIVMNSPLSVSP